MSIGSSCRLCVSCINRKNTFPSCIAQLVVILKVMYFPDGPVLEAHRYNVRHPEALCAFLTALLWERLRKAGCLRQAPRRLTPSG